MSSLTKVAKSVESYLNEVDYTALNKYIPTEFAIQYLNFLKVISVDMDLNDSPPVHFKMIDGLCNKKQYLANLCARGLSKTTLFSEVLFLYLAVFRHIPGFGTVDTAIYVADSMENGVKSLRKNMETRYEKSEQLKALLPKARFTDNYIEFTNIQGEKFGLKMFGAKTGIRGTKIFGNRPVLCHKQGTIVTTEYGTYPVEQHPQKLRGEPRKEIGIKVFVSSLEDNEIVTREHRYLCTDSSDLNRHYWVEAQDLIPMHHFIVDGFKTAVIEDCREFYEASNNRRFISQNYSYKQVTKIEELTEPDIFIPIQTADHTYRTSFGISHNCVLDDLVSDEDASSPTSLGKIQDTVLRGVIPALDPNKRKVIWSGTPFNKADPLYQAIESGGWYVNVYPVCEKFPCSEEEFVGAWEDRFGYDAIKNQFDMYLALGKVKDFNQELMLRITSEEDRMILDSEIKWFDRKTILDHPDRYTFYITTDFATSSQRKADYTVMGVWALDSHKNRYLVDGVIGRQLMNQTFDDLFRLAKKYKPMSVGIEVTGQQGAFISLIKEEMIKRNIFFSLATSKGASGYREGIAVKANKMERFRLTVPQFKLGKIYLPNELKDSILIQELLEEITLATIDGIKSRHDDVIDMISQLDQMYLVYPNYIEEEKIQAASTKSSRVNGIDPFSTADMLDDTDDTCYGSYLV